MGGFAKTLLPVLPLVALGVATGGFGLAAAPAIAGSAASTAAAGAGLSAAAAGVAPVAGGLTNVALGAAGSSVFSTSNLLLASSALRAVGSIAGGNAEAAAQEAQAEQAELQAAQERLTAADRELARQKTLRRTLATQRAIFGARGIDIGTGSPVTLAGASIAEAGLESASDRSLTTGRLASLDLRARNSRADAGIARTGGYAGAAGSLLDFGLNRRRVAAL